MSPISASLSPPTESTARSVTLSLSPSSDQRDVFWNLEMVLLACWRPLRHEFQGVKLRVVTRATNLPTRLH